MKQRHAITSLGSRLSALSWATCAESFWLPGLAEWKSSGGRHPPQSVSPKRCTTSQRTLSCAMTWVLLSRACGTLSDPGRPAAQTQTWGAACLQDCARSLHTLLLQCETGRHSVCVDFLIKLRVGVVFCGKRLRASNSCVAEGVSQRDSQAVQWVA